MTRRIWTIGCDQSNVQKKIQSHKNIYENIKTENKVSAYQNFKINKEK